MLSLPPSVRVYVAATPIDMRKSFDGLSAEVRSRLNEDPCSGHLFAFFNRRRDMVKVLVWDRSGFWVMAKRLERGTFKLVERRTDDGCITHVEMSATDLALILEGIDLGGARRRLRFEEISKSA